MGQYGSIPGVAAKQEERTTRDSMELNCEFMQMFEVFGQMKEEDPAAASVQKQVKELQNYITGHFYHCTPEILAGLGQMYAAGGEFTENIDRVGGEGTAVFTAKAIREYCKNQK